MRPFLLLVLGIVASGKTTVARRLADALGAVHIEADALREERARRGDTAALASGFSETLYPEMLQCAEDALASGRPVILDGCFRSRRWRAEARQAAARCDARFLAIECRAPLGALRERLREREAAIGRESWLGLLDAFLLTWEPVDELPEAEHLVGDTPCRLADLPDRVRGQLALAAGRSETRF